MEPSSPQYTLIGIAGRAGTGKDFLTKNLIVPMLTQGQTYSIMSFADHFKCEAIVTNKLDRSMVYGRKDKPTRVALQTIATDARNKHGPNIWVDILNEKIEQTVKRNGTKYIFITDCRFPNEIEFIKSKNGLMILVEAEDRHMNEMKKENQEDKTVMNHVSETSLPSAGTFNYIIDNSIKNEKNVASDVRDICLAIRNSRTCPITVFCDLDDTLVECTKHYIETKNYIEQLVLSSGLIEEEDEYEFHSYVKLANFKRIVLMETPFQRDGLAKIYKNIVPYHHDFQYMKNRVYELAMGIHDKEFNLLPGAKDTVDILRKHTNLVIVTVGDPVDQVRKLFNVGLSDIPTECVTQKTPGLYAELMKKYPSQRYVMIGDSLHNDIHNANVAGIHEAYLVDEKHPISSIPLIKELLRR